AKMDGPNGRLGLMRVRTSMRGLGSACAFVRAMSSYVSFCAPVRFPAPRYRLGDGLENTGESEQK
ncbi:MAG: hypothetical protein KAQ88_07235, partial [Hyphomicrobiaceae bacterium]|nr:hypothetical protein [Hyphomicrobiaceae bacterium]